MSESAQHGGKNPRKKAVTLGAPAPGRRAKQAKPERQLPGAAAAGRKQLEMYEKAMKLFHSGEFERALECFERAVTGPRPEIVHTARIHRAACEQRLRAGGPALRTPEEHYDFAIALINRRQLAEAERHLLEALKGLGDGDHVHYALAICYGLQGKMEEAAERLRRAIELQPRNRTVARNDPDVEEFANAGPVAAILYPERNPPA